MKLQNILLMLSATMLGFASAQAQTLSVSCGNVS